MVEDFLGQYLSRIDNKRRIFLPSKSGVTKGEQFIIVNDTIGYDNVLRLYGKVQYLSMLQKYASLRDNARTKEDYLFFSQKMEEIYLSIEKVSKVDDYRRIVLPTSSVKHCDLENYVTVLGMGDSILVRKPKNAR